MYAMIESNPAVSAKLINDDQAIFGVRHLQGIR